MSPLERLRDVGPAIILASTLLGPVGLAVAGRTPNLFWCDVLVVAFLAFVAIGAVSLVFTRDVLVGVATLKLRLVPLAALVFVRMWAHRFGRTERLERWSVQLAGLLGLQIIQSHQSHG